MFRFFFVVVAMVLLANAHSHHHQHYSHLGAHGASLRIRLARHGNSGVKAAITNTSPRALNLFYKGTFLDEDAPVDKLHVHGPAARANFRGVLLKMSTTDLTIQNFLPIASGQTIVRDIDIAEMYDVESTDVYKIQAVGSMPYANPGSTRIIGAVPFSSNTLMLDIDGDQAKAVPYAIDKALHKRTKLDLGSCGGGREQILQTALSNCAGLAANAAGAASGGTGQILQRFFRSADSSVRTEVSRRLSAVASDCASRSAGPTTSYCTDQYGFCSGGVLAYTLPDTNEITLCDSFYNLSPLSGQCWGQDQATTLLHETTHSPAVFGPATLDYAYGYPGAEQLSTDVALQNADTYAMYANAVYVGCFGDETPSTFGAGTVVTYVVQE